MRKSFLICFVLMLISSATYSQCDQAMIDKCSSSGSGVKYVKHFRIRFTEATKGKAPSQGNFAVMLNKGSHYRIFTCNDETKPGKTAVELTSDFSGKVGGNFNEATGAEYKAFDFVCNKTGPYYLKMHFKDGKEGCGVCVLTLVAN